MHEFISIAISLFLYYVTGSKKFNGQLCIHIIYTEKAIQVLKKLHQKQKYLV